jgi:hypothetical protein
MHSEVFSALEHAKISLLIPKEGETWQRFPEQLTHDAIEDHEFEAILSRVPKREFLFQGMCTPLLHVSHLHEFSFGLESS